MAGHVTNSRTSSAKASVSEAVVRTWHRTHVIRGRPMWWSCRVCQTLTKWTTQRKTLHECPPDPPATVLRLFIACLRKCDTFTECGAAAFIRKLWQCRPTRMMDYMPPNKTPTYSGCAWNKTWVIVCLGSFSHLRTVPSSLQGPQPLQQPPVCLPMMSSNGRRLLRWLDCSSCVSSISLFSVCIM